MFMVKKVLSFPSDKGPDLTVYGIEMREGFVTKVEWYSTKNERDAEYIRLNDEDSELISSIKKRSK